MLFHVVAPVFAAILTSSATPLAPQPYITSQLLNRSIFRKTNQATSTPGNGLRASLPQCDSALGDQLDANSCRNALAKIAHRPGPVTFGTRNTGNWDVIVPARYLSDDGNCAIDIALDEETLQDADASTYMSIRVAAEDIINTCVDERTPNRGGYVADLGLDNQIFVAVERYDSSLIACTGPLPFPAPPYESCKELIDNLIPQEVGASVFGPAGQAGVEYIIPKAFSSSDGRCLAFLLATGTQITKTEAAWRGIWEDIVAINELCVNQQNQQGMAIIEGYPDNLQVNLVSGLPLSDHRFLSTLNLTASDIKEMSTENMTTKPHLTFHQNGTMPTTATS